ncbi:hypothetical protein PIROE2DRAFT_17978 [Piromyces sp. E2]|nr:hypothetical protein PIROE2DRAFT_17978 [Piromyces sp. E2]|eukprot:OUM57129.1 hypothetical protein PIROE2DRAFT_17978 [Piromyces sp. E2]
MVIRDAIFEEKKNILATPIENTISLYNIIDGDKQITNNHAMAEPEGLMYAKRA